LEINKKERGKDWERERGWEGRVREGGREPLIAQKGILITQLHISFGDKRRIGEKKDKLLDNFITVHLIVFST